MPLAPPATVSSSLDAVGNTPLLRLDALGQPDGADVYVKLESFNPTASYKDRMARAMIVGAEERGTLRPGMRALELGPGHNVVTAVVDSGLRYLAGDLFG